MTKTAIAIIGAGPYGLSLAAHLGEQNVEHRIFGRPMNFWANVASAASERYLKSFCFATNLSTTEISLTMDSGSNRTMFRGWNRLM
jgi:glycerol-3-phosphate dehydrogenase